MRRSKSRGWSGISEYKIEGVDFQLGFKLIHTSMCYYATKFIILYSFVIFLICTEHFDLIESVNSAILHFRPRSMFRRISSRRGPQRFPRLRRNYRLRIFTIRKVGKIPRFIWIDENYKGTTRGEGRLSVHGRAKPSRRCTRSTSNYSP